MDVSQTCVKLEIPIFNCYDNKKYALKFFDGALGSGMFSRLLAKVRNERGLVYSINSTYHLSETFGQFDINFSCKSESIAEVLKLVRTCIEEIAETGLEQTEFEKVKNMLKLGDATTKNSVRPKVSSNTGNLSIYDRIIPRAESKAKFESVTNDDVREVARFILNQKAYVVVAVGKNVKPSDLKSYSNVQL